MRKVMLATTLFFLSIVLIACGKGFTNSSSTTPKQATNATSNQIQNPTPAIGGLASEVIPSSKFQGYKTYKNYRFGYSIDYPGEFVRTRASANGDGVELTSPDKGAILSVAGGGHHKMTIKDLYDSAINNIKGELGYTVLESSWYVVTWKDNGKINYSKMLIRSGSDTHFGFTFTYPEAQKSKYDDVVKKLEASFQSGEINPK